MKKSKRVVVFGNQRVALNCVEVILRNRYCGIVGFVGCEKEIDKMYGYPSLNKFCKSKQIPYYQPRKLGNSFLKTFKNLSPDLCFSIFYRNIIPSEYIKIPKMGIINLHSSLLPKYRGPIPGVWAILNKEKKTGLTLHHIDEGIDTGDIVAQKECLIAKSVTGYELNNILMKKGVQLFSKNLPAILNGKSKRKKQNHKIATYYGKYDYRLRIIVWFESLENIMNKIRAFTRPYDGAVTKINGKKMVIWKAETSPRGKPVLSGPGKIVEVGENRKDFVVTCVNGFLKIKAYDFLDSEGHISKGVGLVKVGARFDMFGY